MQNQTSKLVQLIVPPIGDCTMPMLGPYMLAGYLRRHGITCTVHDASIELLRLVSSPEYLQRLVASESSQHDEPLLCAVRLGTEEIGHCPDAWHRMAAGLKLFSLLLRGQIGLSIDNFDLPFDISNVADLVRAVEAAEPITRALTRTDAFMSATAMDSAIIGLSVSFPSQVVLALALALAIRRRKREGILVFGGSYFCSHVQQHEDLLDTFDCIDVIVRGQGEAVLLDLARGRLPWRLNGVIVRRDRQCIVDAPMLKSSTPDFSDVEWDRYVSGARIAPYSFSTACYYGRCRFCNGDRESSGNSGDGMETEGLNEAVRRFGLDGVYVVDAAIAPADMRRIGTTLPKPVKWAANVRLDSGFMDRALLRSLFESGCYMLRFGLESGSQRILDAMRKGIDIDTASQILKHSAQAGIRNHLYIMLGYPGENDSDRSATIDFLHNHAEFIYSYSLSMFQALPNTPVYYELCDTLSLDSDDEEKAVSAINAYIYPSEQVYARLLECIDRISDTLARTSRSNRNCYSGRVFSDCFIGRSEEYCLDPLVLEEKVPAPCFWLGRFDSVLSIRPRHQRSNFRRAALIYPVQDEVVSIESGEDEVEYRALLGLVKALTLRRNARSLMEVLPTSYEGEWLRVKTCQSHVIQCGPTLEGLANDRWD